MPRLVSHGASSCSPSLSPFPRLLASPFRYARNTERAVFNSRLHSIYFESRIRRCRTWSERPSDAISAIAEYNATDSLRPPISLSNETLCIASFQKKKKKKKLSYHWMRDKFNCPSLRRSFSPFPFFCPVASSKRFLKYMKSTPRIIRLKEEEIDSKETIIRINRRATKRVDVKRRYVENIGEGSARPER